MNHCRLDGLPVELIHHLFSYFSAHEIFSTFLNVSSYFDAVLKDYPYYQINCKSMTKTNFHLVCQYINPCQVITLTLSDDEHTPGQAKLFLSRFQIKQFVHLQSLRLIDIGADFWEIIMAQLVDLKYLRAFHFFRPSRGNSWVSNISSTDITQFNQFLSKKYASILSQLHQLRLNHGNYLKSIEFPHLQHLTLGQSTDTLIKHLSSVAPQLQSLNIEMLSVESDEDFIFPFTQLNRLILHIQDSRHSMHDMEQMISNLPCLKHLQLSANCHQDVINGDRWQILVKHLLSFKFHFSFGKVCFDHDLDSFRTSFWLEEKQWYVVYNRYHLLSVPCFNQTIMNEHFEHPLYSTVPDNNILYGFIDELDLPTITTHLGHYFPHVHTLTVSRGSSASTIGKIVSLDNIQHLIINHLRVNSPIKHLIQKMSNLHQLTIQHSLHRFLTQIKFQTIEKIRILSIYKLYTSDEEDIIERLSIVFPNIVQLHVYETCSIIQIIDFLDRFKHLTAASFQYESWNYLDSIEILKKRLMIQSTLEKKYDYTCRLDNRLVHISIK